MLSVSVEYNVMAMAIWKRQAEVILSIVGRPTRKTVDVTVTVHPTSLHAVM